LIIEFSRCPAARRVQALFHGLAERQAQWLATLPQFGHAAGESCYEAGGIP
jgi:hypothetical protein